MVNIAGLKLYYRERFTLIFYSISSSLLILSIVWLLWSIPPTDKLITLHYNIVIGIDNVGSWGMLWLRPLTLAVFIITNFFLSYILYPKDKYLSYYLGVLSSIASFIHLTYVIVLTQFRV